MNLHSCSGDLITVFLLASDDILITGSMDGTIRLWHIRTAEVSYKNHDDDNNDNNNKKADDVVALMMMIMLAVVVGLLISHWLFLIDGWAC